VQLQQKLLRESLEFPPEILAKLEEFASLLHQWNQIHNLTGAKSIEAIYDNIVDSLYPLSFIKTPGRLLDVGTGAGFPGLILAIALPSCETVLAEPLKKRVSFLRYAALTLGLANVRVEPRRVEQIEDEPFDMISSRAVTDTRLLLELTAALSRSDTEYLFYKGERVFDELSDLSHQPIYDIVQKNRRNYLYIKSRQ